MTAPAPSSDLRLPLFLRIQRLEARRHEGGVHDTLVRLLRHLLHHPNREIGDDVFRIALLIALEPSKSDFRTSRQRAIPFDTIDDGDSSSSKHFATASSVAFFASTLADASLSVAIAAVASKTAPVKLVDAEECV